MKVKHKNTDEVFTAIISSKDYCVVEDSRGEIRKFKKEVIEYVRYDSGWEDVPIEDIKYNASGLILIRVECVRDNEICWVYVPSPHVRIVERDGRSVIQRKKKEDTL